MQQKRSSGPARADTEREFAGQRASQVALINLPQAGSCSLPREEKLAGP